MVKQINLLPWREQKNKLKVRRLAIIFISISFFYLILLIFVKIIIIHQAKHYQLENDRMFLQIKNLSTKVQKLKNLQYEEKKIINIIQAVQINHKQIKKIRDLINYLKDLITPDLFVRLIEFYPPYLVFVIHAKSEKEYVIFKKLFELKFDYKIKWLILNQFQNSQLDCLAQIFFNKKNFIKFNSLESEKKLTRENQLL